MKILVVSNLYPPYFLGGYELGCSNVATELARRGHEVQVLTTPNHARDAEPAGDTAGNVKVCRHLSLRQFQVKQPYEAAVNALFAFESNVSNYTNTTILLDAVRDFRPDCVYLFNLVGIGGISLIDALNGLSFPWVLHLMDHVIAELQIGMKPQVLSVFNAHSGEIYSAGRLISMSQHLLREIENICGYALRSECHIVPGWVDASVEPLERSYGRGGKWKFVSAGAVYEHKGMNIIIDAAKALKDAGVENFSIDIYGDGAVAHYIDQSKQRNLGAQVRFLGPRSQKELIEIFQNSDIFLFPTWEREPFGFAPLEAASVGCIPVITATSGAAERLVNGVHCLKIERSSTSLAQRMMDVCRGDLDFETLSRNAQNLVRQDLSFRHCIAAIEKILSASSLSRSSAKLPTWRDFNRAKLKHEFALSQFL